METKKDYIIGILNTPSGEIPKVSPYLSKRDKWQTTRVRWGIKRMDYKVEPGLYAINNPSPDSIVLVTANFKLTFDKLRKELININAWILVLDTKGINVWCAAGKGTFGTDELIFRIKKTGLAKVINHKKIILPQLGATGVAAHIVKKYSGFFVQYGPIRAADIPEFLSNHAKATPEMRQVKFSLKDRIILIPLEIVQGAPKLFLVAGIFFILSGLHRGGYSFSRIFDTGFLSSLNLLLAFFAGTFLAPVLLPWLPPRSFSLKGILSGLMIFPVSYLLHLSGSSNIENLSWLLLFLAISSFLALNFTGVTSFTSFSGVKKEMKIAIPLQIAAAVLGIGLWMYGRFIT